MLRNENTFCNLYFFYVFLKFLLKLLGESPFIVLQHGALAELCLLIFNVFHFRFFDFLLHKHGRKFIAVSAEARNRSCEMREIRKIMKTYLLWEIARRAHTHTHFCSLNDDGNEMQITIKRNQHSQTSVCSSSILSW